MLKDETLTMCLKCLLVGHCRFADKKCAVNYIERRHWLSHTSVEIRRSNLPNYIHCTFKWEILIVFDWIPAVLNSMSIHNTQDEYFSSIKTHNMQSQLIPLNPRSMQKQKPMSMYILTFLVEKHTQCYAYILAVGICKTLQCEHRIFQFQDWCAW